jgi:hypothetical protein
MATRTKMNSRAIALAARRRAVGTTPGQKSFASGLLMGLGAASLMLAGEIPRPRMPSGTVEDDWRAVMGDITSATKKYGR